MPFSKAHVLVITLLLTFITTSIYLLYSDVEANKKIYSSSRKKAFVAKLHRHGLSQACNLVSFDSVPMVDSSARVIPRGPVTRVPGEKGQDSVWQLLEVVGPSSAAVESLIQKSCLKVSTRELVQPEEYVGEIEKGKLQSIIYNGDPINRIDLVFMGDGYTKSQKKLFLADINRLVDDMFQGETFHSVLPLLNVWALFIPSRESGIGVQGVPKDTTFGLYRDGTELRGIYTSQPRKVRKICQALAREGNCDFPVLIGNDPYYGGLGGEFIIATSSATSGTVVLRHEMGHSMAYAADEYDAGSYFGANSAKGLSNISWKHWLDGRTPREVFLPPILSLWLKLIGKKCHSSSTLRLV